MSQFSFVVRMERTSQPREWLESWAALYPGTDDLEYHRQIARHESLAAADFEEIGQWKDGAGAEKDGEWKKNGRWKPNVASVAYEIGMKAAAKLPKYRNEILAADVTDFLNDWSNKEYTNPKPKHFGLSRAPTLLHFISGGRFPIFDSRVRNAMARLLLNSSFPNTVRCYQESYCLRFSELAALCGAEDVRELDKALFSLDAFSK